MTIAKADQGTSRGADMRLRDPLTCIIIGIDDIGLSKDEIVGHSQYDGPSNDTPLLEHEIDYADRYGIREPIELVRDGDHVIVVKGRKRSRCLRAANERRIARGEKIRLIPSTVISGNVESPGMRRERVMSNWLRREIPMSVKAREAQEMLDNEEMSREEIALHLKVKDQQLNNILGLVTLGKAWTKALDSGEMSPTAALPAIGKSIKEQEEILAKARASTPAGKKPTAKAVRAATGKGDIRTPKVRLKAAAVRFMTLAPQLAPLIATLIPDDSSIWSDLSILASELTDMTWAQLIAGDAKLDELPSTADQVAAALSSPDTDASSDSDVDVSDLQ